MGHSQPLFLYICLFYFTIGRWNFADAWIWAADLWCQKRPLTNWATTTAVWFFERFLSTMSGLKPGFQFQRQTLETKKSRFWEIDSSSDFSARLKTWQILRLWQKLDKNIWSVIITNNFSRDLLHIRWIRTVINFCLKLVSSGP